MKKCTDCGKLVNEHLSSCPHCSTAFNVSMPPGAPVLAAAGAGFAAPTAAMASAPATDMTAPVGAVASFWIRLGAYMLDYLLLMLPVMVLGIAAGIMGASYISQGQELPPAYTLIGMLGYLIAFGIWCFNAIYLQGTTGQTLGKRMCGIMVLQETGEVLGFGRIILREIFKGTISGWVCALGFIWQAFDNEGQAWHDKVAGSYVSYK